MTKRPLATEAKLGPCACRSWSPNRDHVNRISRSRFRGGISFDGASARLASQRKRHDKEVLKRAAFTVPVCLAICRAVTNVGNPLMKKSALLGGAAVLIAGAATAASHPTFFVHKPAHIFITAAPPGSQTLYDQNRDDAGNAVLSDDVDSSQGADDFVVPQGHTWRIKEVDVTGIFFDGSNAAKSENVFFYSDDHGLPGDLLATCPDQNGAGDGLGSFAIQLSKSCKVSLSGRKSTGTHYWVSVQVNIDFAFARAWGWEFSSDASLRRAAWQSVGSRCPTWCHVEGDLMFALKGKDTQ